MRRICLLLSAFLPAACAGSGSGSGAAAEPLDVAVAIVRNPSARIPTRATYALVRGPFGLGEDEEAGPGAGEVDGMLRAAIDATLADRGYVRGMVGQTDLLIGYAVALDSVMDDHSMNMTYGLSPGWVPGGGQAGEQYERGTIVIDVLGGGSRRSLWRGAVQGRVHRGIKPKERRKRIERAVRRLLDNLG